MSVREKSEVLSAVGGMFSYLRSLLKDRELISQGKPPFADPATLSLTLSAYVLVCYSLYSLRV